MMRSGDGFESSYVSIESEIGFLWKVWVKGNNNSAKWGGGNWISVTNMCHAAMLSVSRDLLCHTEYTSTDID